MRRFQRLDAVAGAVAHFQRAMMIDIEAAKAMRDEEMLAEIEDFIEGFNQPTGAVCGSMGFGSLSGHPSMDWWGDGRPEADWLD